MQHIIGFMHRAAHGFQIVDAALDERNLVANFGEVFFLAGGKIVQNHNAFSAPHQFIDGIGSDETSATSDDVSHASNPLSSQVLFSQTLSYGFGGLYLQTLSYNHCSRDSVVYDESPAAKFLYARGVLYV